MLSKKPSLAFVAIAAAMAATPAIARAQDDGDVVTKSPDTIDDVAVAGGGKWLVLKLKGTEGLAIYDADEKKIAKILKLPSSDFVFAAGGDLALVYFRENNILQTWDLKTFSKKKTKPNPMPGVIVNLVMGHSRDDQALVRYAVGTDALDQAGIYQLSTSSLTPVGGENPVQLRGHNGSFRDFTHYRANRDLTWITEWATSHSPSGVGIFIRTGKTYETKYEHDSAGELCMGDDGRVYTSGGAIYTSGLARVGNVAGTRLIPGLGGTLVLGVGGNGALTVYPAGKTTPISPCGRFPDWPEGRDPRGAYNDAWTKSLFTFDKRVVFTPAKNRILFVPAENDRIVSRPFNLKDVLDRSGVDYLVVTSSPPASVKPGQVFAYQVDALSKAGKVKYELELAPEGMTVSPTGQVSWKVPSSFKKAEKVVLLVSDGGGEQTYHNFTLEPEGGAAETPEKPEKPKRPGGTGRSF